MLAGNELCKNRQKFKSVNPEFGKRLQFVGFGFWRRRSEAEI
jgi:hypothetical protein